VTIFGYHIDLNVILLVLILVVPFIQNFLKRRAKKAEKSRDEIELSLTFGDTRTGKKISYAGIEAGLEEYEPNDKVIVVVDINGTILNERKKDIASLAPLYKGVTYGLELGNTLLRISESKGLAAVFIRLSTPGGTIPGSQYVSDGIRACVEKGKPVFCYVQDLAASGGVWSMVGASQIVAHPDSIIGSIGVIGPSVRHYRDVTEIGDGILGQKVHAKEITFHRLFVGKGKDFGDPFGRPDKEAEANFQELLEEAYERFLSHISTFRKNLSTEVLRTMGARLMTARKAKEAGLVDDVGDQRFAQDALAKEIGRPWSECHLLMLTTLQSDKFGLAQFLKASFMGGRGEEAGSSAHQLMAAELAGSPVLALFETG